MTLMTQESTKATEDCGQSPRLVHSIEARLPILPFMLEFTAAPTGAQAWDVRVVKHFAMNLAATCSADEMPCTLATKA